MFSPYEDLSQDKPEVIDLDHIASPPHNKRDSRRDGYSSSSSRKRSPRKSSRERQKEREKERERDRERRKKYLPPFKKNHLAGNKLIKNNICYILFLTFSFILF